MNAMHTDLLRFIRSVKAKETAESLSDQQLLETFVNQRSEASFTVLVQRHGAMVFGVCRRLLRQPQDAEDAFQAVFLTLARQAASIRRHESLGSWLHRVAFHLAAKMKRAAARRTAHEGRLPPRSPGDAMDDITWRELRSALDEELQRLPEKYRAPLVLCYLEARTQDEAAQRLGWSKCTFGRRMNQARQLLAQRLTRRGLTLPAALTAPLLIDGAAQAALPTPLIANTVRAGMAAAMGNTTSGIVSAHVIALAKGSGASLWTKKASLAVVLLVSLTLGIGGLLVHRAAHPRTRAEAPAAPPLSPTRRAAERPDVRSHAERGNETDSLEVHGVVRGPDKKPIEGAKIHCGYTKERIIQQTTTDAEGHYRFSVRREEADPKGHYKDPWEWTPIIVAANGYGLDWRHLRQRDKDNRLDWRLVADDVPLEGRILDLEGRPVVGATIRILRLHATDEEDLSKFLKLWAADPHQAVTGVGRFGFMSAMGAMRQNPPISWRRLWEVYQTGLFLPATTDKDGKFRITGLGRERLVELLLSGPSIEETELQVVTRKDVDAALARNQLVLHSAVFTHLAAPTRPITGIVRDKASGQPLAGIRILGHSPLAKVGRFWHRDIETITDANGVYRLTGLPKDREYSLYAADPNGASYLPWGKQQLDTAGLEPLKIDFELDRGVCIEGRLLDKASGKPVSGAVHYAPLPSNPRIVGRQREAFRRWFLDRHDVGKDGRFKFVAYPGPGIVYAEAATGKYLPISFALADKKLGSVPTVSFTVGGWHVNVKGNAYRLIEPEANAQALKCDLLFSTEKP